MDRRTVNQTLSCWMLERSVARLACGPLEAEVNVERPQMGLQSLRWQRSPLSVQLLGVRWEVDQTSLLAGRDPHWPLLLSDVYVRADDLVATYLPEPPLPYRPQIYWRANPHEEPRPALSSLSLLVSIQTDLLDTRPQLNVVTHLVAEQIVHLVVRDSECRTSMLDGFRTHIVKPQVGMNCVLLRMANDQWSYAECVSTADFHEVWVSPPNDQTRVAKVEWQLFNDFLEKGVIRRAQVHMMLLPRENDVQIVAERCRAIKEKPLPLTT